MKTRIFLLGLLTLVLIGATQSCEKDTTQPQTTDTTIEQPPTDTSAVFSFAGTYRITIVTDSIMSDRQWFDKETAIRIGKNYADQYGTLTIESTNDSSIFRFNAFVNTDTTATPYPYYSTTATLDNDGNLIAQKSNNSLGDTPITFTYETIRPGDTLNFKAHGYFKFGGMDCGYLLINTAIKIN